MSIDEIKNVIHSGDAKDWEVMLSNFSELIEDVIYMFKNPNQFTDNDKYAYLEAFRIICRTVADDNRSTGTLIKHLNLD